MSQHQGLFLVLEGIDGSGKGTQFELLKKRLEDEGYPIASFDFPRYGEPSSYFVRSYLNGQYGSADAVGPYTGSLFFALDRFAAAEQISQALAEGKIVLANRFTGSNMAHQGTKFANSDERRGYFIWLDNLEFQMLGIPRPDKNIVLRVSAETAQHYIDQKQARDYTDQKRDLHEADLSHLQRAVEVYDDLCRLFPKDFRSVDCERSKKLLPVEEVHRLIWETIKPSLPAKSAPKKTAGDAKKADKVPNPYIEKSEHGYKITSAGEEFLRQAVTNTKGSVYGFTDKLSPVTIAAAMARLSRRGDDMRVTILDEFAMSAGKDEKLLQRVITAYGDDSVQQLIGQHLVVEGASNLLTKKLEWGRLAAYLEQSTRYIYFDQKDEAGNYKYYMPVHFSDETKKKYKAAMDKIFGLYSDMVHKLTKYVRDNSTESKETQDIAWQGATRAQACDAIRPVLPVAAKATVGIFASGQALESLIMHLLSDELPEAREVGQKILDESRKVLPTFLERADKPDRGGAWIAYRANTRVAIAKATKKFLKDNHSPQTEPVTLVDVSPRNELDLVADMLYESSSLPLAEITKQVGKWTIDKKEAVFKAYIGERLNRRHRPGRALEKAHYSWDLVCDYGIFRDLQRHRMVEALEWQELTPRYGYEVPKLVEEAGLSDAFEECFDTSLKLYSELQTAGYAEEAQYATLLGHRMRWKLIFNGRQAFHMLELRTTPQGHPGYRKLCQQIYDKIAEIHPLMGEAMKFVNQGEDPGLTRLAAERYTQFKLAQLKAKE